MQIIKKDFSKYAENADANKKAMKRLINNLCFGLAVIAGVAVFALIQTVFEVLL